MTCLGLTGTQVGLGVAVPLGDAKTGSVDLCGGSLARAGRVVAIRTWSPCFLATSKLLSKFSSRIRERFAIAGDLQ
jgi:hypothetical protein